MRRYDSSDMTSVPWPRAEPSGNGESTRWQLQLARSSEDDDAEIIVERLELDDPALSVSARAVDEHDVIVEFVWARYDGDALARSVQAIRLATRILPVVAVQGVELSKWAVLLS